VTRMRFAASRFFSNTVRFLRKQMNFARTHDRFRRCEAPTGRANARPMTGSASSGHDAPQSRDPCRHWRGGPSVSSAPP
jgi:hypothetical protein